MHAVIVVAHPDRTSLTHAVAQKVSEGIAAAGADNSFEIADLSAEGFDPRYTQQDFAAFSASQAVPDDVAAEQSRLDRADALVLVYPVYWWSMPAVLKGWLDRVFTRGWAYDDLSERDVVKMLGRLSIHLVAIGAADERTYTRHGYFGAMRTQIDHGVFGYCGAPVMTSEFLLPSEAGFPGSILEKAEVIGQSIFASGREGASPLMLRA